MKFDFVDVPTLHLSLRKEEKDGKRFYETPTGELYPSVTTILSEMNKKSILEWRNSVGNEEANRISSKASSRGTKVHKLCEDYLQGKDLNAPNPLIKEMFLQLKPSIDQKINNIHAIECPLFSHKLKMAGTVDLIAEYENELAIIDYKTASKPKKEEYILNYLFQATIYSLMLEEMTGLKAKKIVIMIAVEGQTHPQIFERRRKDYIVPLLEFLKKSHLN